MSKSIKTVIMFLMVALISVTTIVSDLIKFGATSSVFNTAYWSNALLTNASAIIIIFLSNSIRKDKLKDTHEVFTELQTALRASYAEMNRLSLLTAFQTYIETDNRRAKLEAYKEKLNRKAERVRDKIQRRETRYNAFRVWRKKEPLEEVNTWRLVHLRAKEKALQVKIDKAEKNIEYVRVRYLKVSYSAIFGESERAKGSERDMSYHTAAHNVGVVLKKVLFIGVFGFVATLDFTFSVAEVSVYFIYKTCMRLYQIGMALYTGISDADKFVATEMCDALRRRINYVQGFTESKRLGTSREDKSA